MELCNEISDEEIRQWTDWLLSMAIAKCGSLEDAQDLTQDALLALLTYKAQGKTIDNSSAFLHTVLNRKYFDLLRRKYQLPTVTIADQEVLIGEEDFVCSMIRRQEGERIRREVAFLAESYRTIIVMYYFLGKSIREISLELNLPQGTVKSRLDYGRKQLKKGFEAMEEYTENSYIPHVLMVAHSGGCGLEGEPVSLTRGDTLVQNLLILAYSKPVSIPELSKAIGVSSAYVEPVVDKLVKGELMKRMGDGRVYTDFIIYQADDFVRYLDEQKDFAKKYSNVYCSAVRSAVAELKKTSFYSLRLERYMLIAIAEIGLYQSYEDFCSPQICPDRPNGGRWIAWGVVDPSDPTDFQTLENERFQEDKGFQKDKRLQENENYRLSGQRYTNLDGYLGAGRIALYNYETALYPSFKYDGLGFHTFIEAETNVLKLLYLIRHGISPQTVDCDTRILKAIPLLEERGFLAPVDGGHKILIPCLTPSEGREFWSISKKAASVFAQQISGPMEEYATKHKVKIPAHLKSVPDPKLFMPCEPKPMMFVFEAIKQGIHPRDLGFLCPEVIAVME